MTKLKIGTLGNSETEEELERKSPYGLLGLEENNILVYSINSKNFGVNLTELFELSLNDEGDYSEIDLEKQIEKGYSPLISFKVSQAQINRKIKLLKEEFNKWISIETIYKYRNSDSKISDARLLKLIMSDEKINGIYFSKKQEIIDWEYRLECIDAVIETLSKRIESFRSILKGRKELKGRTSAY